MPRTRRKASLAGRPRGRPAAQSRGDVRAALLATARTLFSAQGFERISIRQLAAAAATTPAMIHYYFGDKQGLYEAMIEATIEPLVQRINDMIQNTPTQEPDLGAVVNLYMRIAAANPWLPTLIINEVLSEGGRLRKVFVQRFAAQLVPKLVAIIRHEQRRQRFTDVVDPKLAALSVVSLCAFPFLARAVVEPVFGMELHKETLERFIAHTQRVLLSGLTATDGQSS